ncbi:SDR family NAD(P)-dependent oxidoreductase [Silicimonas algicola]|uniref:Short-subunit dehydrogenase n=1 Tax=Silicimonas algicola TaxID=1826607 RepID=A0A316FVW0_9RHOB|nr:SDR family NAD(P)-dependent oxidoreductase [Silicimonas algicola]AZQ67573.1 SDR family NAD(P)-dependent oxidoreductase [Silicimonas algicola]PWK52728.1 short-subunit dehydrogenase [Silicimonas algicola]
MNARTHAVVTGASSGLGFELARLAAQDGHDLTICADEEEIEQAAETLRRLGVTVDVVRADLTTRAGAETLWTAIDAKPVDLFFANVGRALGHAFHEQDWSQIRRRIELNVFQTTFLLHRVGAKMRDRGRGRILVTGSLGGFVPGPYDAVYNSTKAYLNSLCYALQDEWKDTPVSLTCLTPGPVETPIFTRRRNDLSDAPITGQSKADAGQVARAGYDGMMAGKRNVYPKLTTRLTAILSGIVPLSLMSKIHRRGAEPR